jgi:hypothetical protein
VLLTHFVSGAILLDDFDGGVKSYASDDVTNFEGVDLSVTTVPEVKKLKDFLGLCKASNSTL